MKSNDRSWWARATLIALMFASSALTGCATLPRNPVPEGATGAAVVPGMPDVRAWAGTPSPALQQDFERSVRDERERDFPVAQDGRIHYPHLALSGGGANGAYGAGFLNGWTKTGKRPVFKLVTGVSTGALMAPYAFLGPAYDDLLKQFYTNISDRDVFTANNPLVALLKRESLARTVPLEQLIANAVDDKVLEWISEEHRHGRRLYMGTVDLDAKRFVVWDMGAIASRGTPQAYALFRKVMLASASIPIAFPPVLLEVEANGKRYDEMHVDGFLGSNAFVHVGAFDPQSIYNHSSRAAATYTTYLIHNGQLNAYSPPAQRSLRGIASRSIDAASRSGMIADLFREYAYAARDGAEFKWVTISSDIALPNAATFDMEKMRALYRIGYDAAVEGPRWSNLPPGVQNVPTPP